MYNVNSPLVIAGNFIRFGPDPLPTDNLSIMSTSESNNHPQGYLKSLMLVILFFSFFLEYTFLI